MYNLTIWPLSKSSRDIENWYSLYPLKNAAIKIYAYNPILLVDHYADYPNNGSNQTEVETFLLAQINEASLISGKRMRD